MPSHTLHLIDASPYVFRAYFALPAHLTDERGRPNNAVAGFARFLVNYIEEHRPTHVGVAFDESLTTSFRNEIYPEYKAQRELPPRELVEQLASCQTVVRTLGCHAWADRRYEADDLIATACAKLVPKGHRAIVVSSDKDLAQLVGARVELFDAARDERYDPSRVRGKFGVHPGQIPDYLGLAGDSVDNIPGVPGVGPKTAASLLAHFEDLEGLYADLEGVADLPIRGAGRLADKLIASRELAFLSRELATLSRRAPATGGLAALRRRRPRRAQLEPIFRRLGIARLVDPALSQPAPG